VISILCLVVLAAFDRALAQSRQTGSPAAQTRTEPARDAGGARGFVQDGGGTEEVGVVSSRTSVGSSTVEGVNVIMAGKD
jgi:hypothetical protein